MTDTRQAFGNKVRYFRNRRHWNQTVLAEKANLSQSDLSKIETGNLPGNPSTELIKKLADALEITPETLVSGTPLSILFDGAYQLSNELHEPAPPLEGKIRVEEEHPKVTPPKRISGRKTVDPFRICGTVLNGKYELTEFAGSGGMGAVYRALNIIDLNIVAVKILQPHIVARSPECAELFEREAKHAQSLDHPHIVRIFDSGKDEDLSYMVLEWVEGRSIEDVLTQEQLPLDRLTNIFKQICSAVTFAHERNIIHLDLKPGNILLLDHSEPDDFVKVIDFGLSRVISKESGTTVTKFRGTHQFCAPEQFGGKVSHRSDIYSLGATLYYLLTGVIPFGTSYINAKIHPNLELPEIPSVVRQRSLPPALDHVINKALNKNPDLRQQSAEQLFEEFKAAISSDDVKQERDLPLEGETPLDPITGTDLDRSGHRRGRRTKLFYKLIGRLSYMLAAVGIFASILIGVWLLYAQRVRTQASRSALEQEIAKLSESSLPSDIVITLYPNVLRGEGAVTEITLQSDDQVMRLNLSLIDDRYASYDWHLKSSEGNVIASGSNFRTVPQATAKMVVLRVPAKALASGGYVIRLSRSADGVTHEIAEYYFQVAA